MCIPLCMIQIKYIRGLNKTLDICNTFACMTLNLVLSNHLVLSWY